MKKEIRIKKAKYWWRTGIRRRLPYSLSWVVPKGKKDCGFHSLYIIDKSEDNRVTRYGCYHCIHEETRLNKIDVSARDDGRKKEVVIALNKVQR